MTDLKTTPPEPDPDPEAAGCACASRSRPGPGILVPAATLSSALGDDVAATLSRLADPAPWGDAPEGAAPDAVLERGLAAAEKLGVPEGERTRELLLALAGAAPLFEKALAAGIPADEIGFVFGGTTGGTREVTRILRERPEASPEETWELMDIGRTAPEIARAAGVTGPVITVSTACTASAKAILEGARLLSIGRVRAVVAGGVDVLSPLTEGGFSALGARSARRARPFSADRSGLHLGEGGGFLLLSTDEKAFPDARVRLAGGGETSDAHHICAPEPEGRGAAEAIRAALGGLGPRDIGLALLHGTATQQNDAMESRAMLAALPGVPCASLKRAAGHQLAGAGAFSAAVAWGLLAGVDSRLPLNFQTDTAPSADPQIRPEFLAALTGPAAEPQRLAAPRILAAAFAFGGSNAAVLLERIDRTGRGQARRI